MMRRRASHVLIDVIGDVAELNRRHHEPRGSLDLHPPYALFPGGPEYGPISHARYLAQWEDYEHSLDGHGFVDWARAPAWWRAAQPRINTRRDLALMARFLDRHAHELPRLELAVAVLAYRDYESDREIAARLDKGRETVKECLRRTRTRAKLCRRCVNATNEGESP